MPAPREIVITSEGSSLRYWRDLWDYREIFWILSWRDLLVRYKQTAIGITWSVLRPLLTMLVFTAVFGQLARLPSEGIPYALFVFAATLPWQLFANALSEGSNSLVANSNLLTKVYFPRLIIPGSVLLVSLLDSLISLVLFFLLAAWYGISPDWHLLALPLFLALAAALSLGFAIWLAALNALYRDFRYVIPFLVQLGLYLSPVGFSSTIIPARWRALYSLNPMVGVIDGFRWALLRGRTSLEPVSVAMSILLAIAVLLLATRYFRATERVLADVI